MAAPAADKDGALIRTRAALASGRFVLSEHVVRSLMSGSIRMADIEAALTGGTVIEVHSHVKRGISRLLAVLNEGRPIHVMCGEGADDWLVVAFAYIPSKPIWATPGRRSPKGDATMNRDFANCYFCGGEIKTVTVGNFDYRKEGRLYVIKKVPAGLCLECGEKYIAPDIGRRMDDMIANERFTGTEPVNVIDFSES